MEGITNNNGFKPLRYIQCSECRGKPGPKGMPGYYYHSDGRRQIVECNCHKEWVNKNKVLIEAFESNIQCSEFNQHYSFDKYIGEKSKRSIEILKAYTENYEKDARLRSLVLYIQGPSSSQKTTIAQNIGLNIFRLGFKAYYMRMKGFNDIICMNTIGATEEQIKKREGLLKKFEAADCLILDDAFDKDLAPVYSTGSQSPYIEGFLRDRIEGSNKGVIFVSRVALDDIKKNGYSLSLQDFVKKHVLKTKTLFTFNDVINEYNMSVDFDIESFMKKN